MSLLLAVDPGLDACGWAIYALPATRGPKVTYQTWLKGSGTIKTAPGTGTDLGDIQTRVDTIRDGLLGLVAAYGLETGLGEDAAVVLEVPSAFGPYANKGPDRRGMALQMARSMGILWYLIGTIRESHQARGATVTLLKAAGKKTPHHAMVRTYWPHLGRTNEDQRDAIWLGLRFLTDARRR